MADDAAFEAFVREHSASLIRTAVLVTGSKHAAEELVQDTLTLLYPRWARVAAADQPLAYVRRSLVNRFISQRRRPGALDVAVWELPDGWDGTDLGETVAVRRTIWQLLGTLPERQRAAIVLRHFHDLPETEIAATLGCRPGSVRSLISRGLGSMRSAYTASDVATRTGTTS
jgi:RNA polymerase sigma-70 factor (sigma-E family)